MPVVVKAHPRKISINTNRESVNSGNAIPIEFASVIVLNDHWAWWLRAILATEITDASMGQNDKGVWQLSLTE